MLKSYTLKMLNKKSHFSPIVFALILILGIYLGKSLNFNKFQQSEFNKFNLVLVFETIEVDEISAEYIKQYNDEGYRIAHTKDRIQYRT